MSAYCAPDEVAVIRLYKEEGDHPGWHIDGMSLDGRFTESCWTFNAEETARLAIPAFMKENGILATTVLVEESSMAMAEKIRDRFRKKES